jgi:hypothetical protein
MRALKKFAVMGAAVCMITSFSGCATNSPIPNYGSGLVFPQHPFDHLVLVVLENEDATLVERIPYMDSLARKGALLRNYYGVAHPSYPNYLALISGLTFVGTDPRARHDPEAYRGTDFGDAQLLIDAPTIVDRLSAGGLTWGAFAEDYPDTSQVPSSCDFRRAEGKYARKHLPFLSFQEFHEHPAMCAHVRNLKWLDKDSLAAYTFIAPNLIHDGHDAPMDSAVTWLRGFLAPILADSSVMKSTVIAITFDESANTLSDQLRGKRPNRVFTVLVGGPVQAGVTSNAVYSHFSMLRTIEANFQLKPTLVPANAPPIAGIWK